MTDPSADRADHRTPLEVRARLAAMMFLHYSGLGVWAVTVGTYIAANTGEAGSGIFTPGFVGYSSAAGAIGSLLAPLVLGHLSDRFFSAPFLLAATHAGCAAAATGMCYAQSQTAFFVWLLVYFHCFLPGCALTNTICLRHLRDSDAEYPLIRIFSTLGWICAGLLVGLFWPSISGATIETTAIPLLLGAIISGVMVPYSLFLPATPPRGTSPHDSVLGSQAGGSVVANRRLIVFLIIAALASALSMAYGNYANLFLNQHDFPRPAALMTLGQLSDMLCLWATPWLIAKFGLRTLFAVGIFAWTLRYLILAISSQYALQWPVYAAIAIHGPCFVFVYVVGLMYVDRIVLPAYRGASQGMYSVATTGVGHLFGGVMAGIAQTLFLTPADDSPLSYEWGKFWLVPTAFGSLTLLAYLTVIASKFRRSVE